MKRIPWCSLLAVSILFLCGRFGSSATDAKLGGHTERIGDVTVVEGIRENALVGYGLVVGLNRTGDSQQTMFSTQSVANALVTWLPCSSRLSSRPLRGRVKGST
jgi:flagellar basal body P-ring protein FlgI